MEFLFFVYLYKNHTQKLYFWACEKKMHKKTKLIGISGCTNGGKTTLCSSLRNELSNAYHISQDDYYYPREQLEYLHELDSYNFDVISAINMQQFKQDILKLCKSEKYDYILIDGFLIYEDQELVDILDKKYFLLLDKEECLRRRNSRNYKTVDTPNYFEKCVWIEFSKYKQKCQNIEQIIFLEGSDPAQTIVNTVKSDLKKSSML